MIRILLTLLALMTGLAAETAPAEARLLAPRAMQVQPCLAALRLSAPARPGRPVAPLPSARADAPRALPLPAADAPSRPAVLIGPDRARE